MISAMRRGVAGVAAAMIAAGLLLLLAALVPWVPWLQAIAVQGPGPVHAAHVAYGLLLLLAGTVVLAASPPVVDRRVPIVVAAALPAGVALGVLLASGRELLTPGVQSPELARLLLVASPAAAILSPLVLAVVLAQPSGRAAPGRLDRYEPWLLLGILGAFGVVVVLGMAQQAPFGWDESVYALMPRHWLQGTPDTGWGPHRPLVLSALGVIPLLVGTDEWIFRVIGLSFGLGLVAAAWFLARAVGGAAAGLLAAAAVAAAPTIASESGLFLNDVPAAGVLVLAAALLWRAMERPGPVGWGLVWVAPVAAAAFYLRYGSAIPLAGLAVAALIVWPARLAEARVPALVTMAVLAILLAPHALFAMEETGSPLGIVLVGQANAAPDVLGGGVAEYLDWLPAPLAGVVPGALIVLGLAGAAFMAVVAWRQRSADHRTRALTFLVLTALIQVIALGVLIHAEMRYLFFAVVLLIVAGCLVLVDAARRRGAAGRSVMALATAAVCVSLLVNVALVPDIARGRVRDFGWERAMGIRIAQLAGGGHCSVLGTSVPQITWYSGCAAVNFGDRRNADRDRLLTGDHRYLLVRADGGSQPEPGIMSEYLARVDPQPLAAVNDDRGEVAARLYRFRQ